MKCDPRDGGGKCVREDLLASLSSRDQDWTEKACGVHTDRKPRISDTKSKACVKISGPEAVGQHQNSNSTWRETSQPAASSVSDTSVSDLCYFTAQISVLRWTVDFLTPVLTEEVLPLHTTACSYLWSLVWYERRSQMCVPSVCPESQMERAAWQLCWGVSSPYRAQTCQWRR